MYFGEQKARKKRIQVDDLGRENILRNVHIGHANVSRNKISAIECTYACTKNDPLNISRYLSTLCDL